MKLQNMFGPLIVLSFGGLMLGAAWLQRPSVCINSKSVERIDMPQGKQLISVFRCNYAEPQSFLPETNQKIQEMDQSFQSIERFLENIRPFRYRVVIKIQNDKPFHYKISPDSIEIGLSLIEKNYLERALIKAWLLQDSMDYFSENQLALEALTDTFIFAYSGDLKARNELTQQSQELGDVPRWPLSLANLETYCRGSWIVPEHLQTCSQKVNQPPSSVESEVIDWSLRPLVSKIWVATFKSLPLKDQKRFLEVMSSVPEHIEKTNVAQEWEKTFPQTVFEELVITTRLVVQNLSKWVAADEELSKSVFFKNLQEQVSLAGFQDHQNLPRFDFLLKIDVPISAQDERLLEMKSLSEMNPHLNMAVHAGGQIWLLPNMTAVADKTFAKINTHRMIYEACHMNFGTLLDLNESTEKILLIKSCHDSSRKKYSSFMNDGIAGFALQNPKAEFVHFHLPSLALRKNSLNFESDVFSSIAQRDLNDPLFQALGWESLNWVERYKAYHPKAQIEAIEWFRLF